MKEYRTAIVGATGAVGRELIETLEQRAFPVGKLELFASRRAEGRFLQFRGARVPVRPLEASAVAGTEVAFFSAGGAVSKEFAPLCAANGALVVDNSSAFRQDRNIPLVIPELNGSEVVGRTGIVANPNCSTVQLVLAVAPLQRLWGLRQLCVATYQSVSGTGGRAIQELSQQARSFVDGAALEKSVYPHQIAFNLFPHVGDFGDDGLNVEERKVVYETRRFLKDEALEMNVTAVRVPVFRCHSEAVVAVTKEETSAAQVKQVLRSAPGVRLVEGEDAASYATPVSAEGRDEVFVSRVRDAYPEGHGIAMWVVSDNLRKGAALNAVQIAEVALGLSPVGAA
ncbi:MAG: aspartate-semialdehyde dehydrogenase [Candidatus Eisenbacteria bacterium]|nr:aspartate-semialdehyde dehydrogenase [Candidatus Eisenbacteria bacterium]